MVFLHIQSASLYTIKLFQVNIYTFDHILIFTKTLAEKPPQLFLVYLEQSWSPRYSFRLKIMILENWAEKPPPPHFCLFVMDWARVTQVEYPMSPYYKSIIRFLLSEYLL